ncbi:DUF4157 domain-containing protein [Vitiosangium sp. GDMCC 1.1324]|uniref:eCIS core domain-containing protein n=1 Tax=Vitiosangium sp. (strain GDMCC 1.1324) TaxID=2138576 RepID=UPI000D376C21|nr:DUF4157 domain-containing protein [Vitiosangium sp. GDMCC 1.1324]PTL76286.1 hypothetical protein DAT35_50490 [Vitiosangium sp. GDMCC 1.1324]
MSRRDKRATGTRVEPEPSAGEPLPALLRSRMEAFWREDLSDVRLHVRPEVAALGAAALAVGPDIWFAPGMCDPSSPRGLQVLGHELAHVLQQRAGRVRPPPGAGVAIVHDTALEAEADRMGAHAASFVIRGPDAPEAPPLPRRRARPAPASPRVAQCMPFGVELECSKLEIVERRAKKGTVIVEDGKTFKAVYEATSEQQPVVEFVTQPPANSEKELVESVGNMVALARKWDQQMKANDGWFTSSARRKTVVVQTGNAQWVIRKQGPMEVPITGMLQITIGVPLRAMPLMYRTFASGDQHLHNNIRRHWENLRKAAHENKAAGPDGRPLSTLHEDTWGFLLLVMDYINRANSPYGKPYVKAVFDTLARTDFATIFGLLPPAEQQRLATGDGKDKVMRDVWIRWLLGLLVRDLNEREKLADRKMVRWINVSDKPNAAIRTNRLPTLWKWLESMPHEDLFTEKHSSHFLGLGAMGKKVDTLKILGREEKAPIIELRAPLGSGISLDEWVPKVSDFWHLYQQLLIPPRPQRPLPPRPPRPPAEAVAAAIRAREALEARADAKAEQAARNSPQPTPKATPAPLGYTTRVDEEREPSRPPEAPKPFVRTHYPSDRPRSYYDQKDRENYD